MLRFLLHLLFLVSVAKLVHSFAECSDSIYPDPGLLSLFGGVTNCRSWAAYLQRENSSFLSLCLGDERIALKCCWTCKAYLLQRDHCERENTMTIVNCTTEARNCNQTVKSTGLPVSYFCPKTCGLCGALAGPSCSMLGDICGDHGKCSSKYYFGVQTSQCVCDSSYVGHFCNRTNLCEVNRTAICGTKEPLKSTCVALNEEDNQYECKCNIFCYGGTCNTCSCELFPCLNGGICYGYGTYANCVCRPYYNGSTCETYFPCTKQEGSCLHEGACNSNGSCTCTSGWTGYYCEIPLGCNRGDTYSCLNDGQCVARTGICNCKVLYEGSYCQNYYGCDNITNRCLNNGTCLANLTCACTRDFAGRYCNSAWCRCLNDGNCTNYEDNTSCKCLSLFDGFLCHQNNRCSNFSGECLNGGECKDKCECSGIYYGAICEQTASCINGTGHCLNNGTCGNKGCNCLAGFEGTACELKSCKNGGTRRIDGYCLCRKEFAGLSCETDVNETVNAMIIPLIVSIIVVILTFITTLIILLVNVFKKRKLNPKSFDERNMSSFSPESKFRMQNAQRLDSIQRGIYTHANADTLSTTDTIIGVKRDRSNFHKCDSEDDYDDIYVDVDTEHSVPTTSRPQVEVDYYEQATGEPEYYYPTEIPEDG